MATLDLRNLFPESSDGTHSPLPKQAEFLNLVLDPKGPQYIGYFGGVGCLSSSELVATEAGLKPISSIRPSDQVLTVGGSVQGIAAFPAGKGCLYRVKHEHGEFVASGSHLVFCSDHKYRRVTDLLGHALLKQPSPLPTSSALCQSESQPSVAYSIQTALDWLDHCLEYCRRYGPLPREVLDIGQSFAPLLAGAPESVQISWRLVCEQMGALAGQEQDSIRLCQLYDRLSTLGSVLRSSAQAVYAGDQALKQPSAPVSQATPGSSPDPLSTLPHLLGRLDPNSYTFEKPSGIPSKVLEVSFAESNAVFWDLSIPNTACYYGADNILHHNSGKSMILCVTMITQGILHGGEYVVARQFMPELRRTTYKQFKEILPKELIIEDRIADAEIRIKAANNKTATFYFVGLDDPDKLRSLNLSGFGIDEASQISEDAFLLLQGRLRNKLGLRKGIMVGNPAGRNWVYRYLVAKNVFKDEKAKAGYHMILAPSTENIHLPEGYVQGMLNTYSPERIARDIMGSFDAFEGQVYSEFSRAIHVIKPFRIPDEWERVAAIDHGFRNPAACVWGAVDYDGNVYVYQEYYETEQLIEQIVKGNPKEGIKGLVELTGSHKLTDCVIDPSTKAVKGQTGISDFDTYLEHLPKTFPLRPADNNVMPGIDRVKSYLRVSDKTKKPRLFIFETCTHLIEELLQYQWKPLGASSEGHKNQPEEVVKKDDHLCDALRYMIMTRPESPKQADKDKATRNVEGVEGSLRREFHEIKTGRASRDGIDTI